MSNTLTVEQLEARNKNLLQFVGSVLNKPSDEIASLAIKEDGEANENFVSELTTQYTTQLNGQLEKVRTNYDNGYKAAESKIKGDQEKRFNTEFGFEGEGSLFERVKAWNETKVSKAVEGIQTEDLTPEKVKNSATYLELFNIHEQEKKASDEKFRLQDEAHVKAQNAIVVKTAVSKLVKAMNPIYSKNPSIAANQEADIINKVSSGNWGVENGELVPFGDDNTRLLNELKHPIKTEDVITGIVGQFYELNAQNGNPPANGGGSQGGSSTGFKDIDTSDKHAKKLAELYQNERKASQIVDADEKTRQLQLIGNEIVALQEHGVKLNF